MAHWVELDENNYVIRVTVGDNNDPNGDEGYQWLVNNLGGNWVKTSYTSYGGKRRDPITNEPIDQPGFRYNYAGVGFSYDPIRDAFIPPKPEPLVLQDGTTVDWKINEETCLWEEDR